MKVTVLRKMRYGDRFIYIMQFSTIFQYLIAGDDGDIYQDHIVYKPKLRSLLLWKMGVRDCPYAPHELEDGEQIILSGAMATVDKIRDPEFKKDEPTNLPDRSKYDCEWQTREAKDGIYYMCLVHGVAVKMKEGEKPKHD